MNSANESTTTSQTTMTTENHGSNVLPETAPEFAKCVLKLLNENQPQEALELVNSNTGQMMLQNDCSDAITNVVKFLTNGNFVQNAKLYNGCEEILKAIAGRANNGEVILELLEVIDTTKNDNTVVSILKALQVCLLNQGEGRVRSLEWCLNSIQLYVSDLPLSAEVRQRIDTDEEEFLEEDEEVRRIISFYFYLFLFYEPILDHVLAEPTPDGVYFRDRGITRRNVIACFIIQLFSEPFALLEMGDLSREKDVTKRSNHHTYSRQCATSLVKHIVRLFPDPLQLLGYGERRKRWPYVMPEIDESNELIVNTPFEDIFHIDEKAPIVGLSVMFYVMLAENLLPPTVPKVYSNVYIFEMGLYYATELLGSIEDSLHYKGIRLGLSLLERLGKEKLKDETLDLEIHITFLKNLVNVLNVTQLRKNSKNGVDLLKNYLAQFESIEAKHFHIRRLLRSVDNYKICSLLVTIYKNIIAEQLNAIASGTLDTISPFCSGDELRTLVLDNICIIPNGVETDILQRHDLILAALNMLRFLTLRDKNNDTKLWDYIDQIQENFLKPLREAIDCSRAQYKLEEKRIIEKDKPQIECNISMAGGEDFTAMTKENRLQVLTIGRNTFDLIDSLMSRLHECIEMREKSAKNSPVKHAEKEE